MTASREDEVRALIRHFTVERLDLEKQLKSVDSLIASYRQELKDIRSIPELEKNQEEVGA